MHILNAEEKIGSECELKGWIYRKRSSGGIIFIIIRDSTGIIQVAVKKEDVDSDSWKIAEQSTIESSIIVTGVINADKRAPTGYEVKVKKLQLIHLSEPYPITEYQSTELLLDKRHLWLRSRKMTNILIIRSLVFKYIRDFYELHNFWEVTPPLITKTGGESGADMFNFDFFGEKAYLTQSSQLYLEALVPSLEKVYSLVPSFRAEKSRTIKHLAEYWHMEVESAYYGNEENMQLQEEMISYLCKRLVEEAGKPLDELGVDKEHLRGIKPPFKRITYSKAIEFLNENGAHKEFLEDLGTEDEKILTEKENKPIFVYNWPVKIKAFYMKADPDNPEFVLNSDMLAPHGHGEIIGGSERIWNYEELIKRMNKFNMNIKDFEWYLDLRRYGSIPHSGFGFGVERFIKWVLNLDHIRDAIPFPRMINRLEP
jgi:asparaginyl-tRNA synthetase